MQTALLAVLGERGHWLAQFSPEWSWATPTDTAFTDKPLAGIEALWQEQTLPQRVEILRYVRAIEPDTARAWVAAVWKQENAETRARLLSALEVNLSEKDEEFLERALNDRGKSVCAQAIQLLADIPTSAFNQRIQERADTLLHYTDGSLRITVQDKFDPSWRRDGIMQDGKHKNLTTESLLQIISRVSPAHWEERFAASPVMLLEATRTLPQVSDTWLEAVVDGWTVAAVSYNTATWFEPLLDWRAKHGDQGSEEYFTLFKRLPQDRVEQLVLPHMFVTTIWVEELAALPRPWSSSFSRACLATLQERLADLTNDHNYQSYYYQATQLMDTLATALPPDCFDIALAEWAFSTDAKENNWYVKYWNDQINNLQSLLRIRKNIQKEII